MNSFTPRKRFGQNFLKDPHIIATIIEAIHAQRNDIVVEIGPGLGALTQPLLAQLAHLYVIEIDKDLIARLKQRFPADQMTLYQGDALAFDFAVLPGPLKVVGNLPYNISTPLLFHLAHYAHLVVDMHFMLQKEVVDRLLAEPGSAGYGRLSVMMQYRFDMIKVCDVPPHAFWPAPRVHSAVVRMVPLLGLRGVAHDEACFARLVATAFSHRRKTLRNNLAGVLDEATLISHQIDPNARAEELSVEQYIRLAHSIPSSAQ